MRNINPSTQTFAVLEGGQADGICGPPPNETDVEQCVMLSTKMQTLTSTPNQVLSKARGGWIHAKVSVSGKRFGLHVKQ
jgi:hypothetical protein